MSTTIIDRATGLASSAAIKAPCRVAITAGIPVLSGIQTVNGILLNAGDRVLRAVGTSIENGVYIVSSDDWERAPDFNGINDVLGGTIILVDDVPDRYIVQGFGPYTPGVSSIEIVPDPRGPHIITDTNGSVFNFTYTGDEQLDAFRAYAELDGGPDSALYGFHADITQTNGNLTEGARAFIGVVRNHNDGAEAKVANFNAVDLSENGALTVQALNAAIELNEQTDGGRAIQIVNRSPIGASGIADAIYITPSGATPATRWRHGILLATATYSQAAIKVQLGAGEDPAAKIFHLQDDAFQTLMTIEQDGNVRVGADSNGMQVEPSRLKRMGNGGNISVEASEDAGNLVAFMTGDVIRGQFDDDGFHLGNILGECRLNYNSGNDTLEIWSGGTLRGHVDLTGSDHAL